MVVTYVPRWLRGSNESMVVKEFIASCPGCKTFETLWFRGNVLMPTRRFNQKGDGKVYHDCGWEVSFQLFFSRYEERNNGNPANQNILPWLEVIPGEMHRLNSNAL